MLARGYDMWDMPRLKYPKLINIFLDQSCNLNMRRKVRNGSGKKERRSRDFPFSLAIPYRYVSRRRR